MTRILITGGAGFIGGALIRRLLVQSDMMIFNLDKIGYASDLKGIEQTLLTSDSKRYVFQKVDLLDFQKTVDAVVAADPDLVMHLAAESHVDRSIDTPSSFMESNIIGTFNILEAVRQHWNSLTTSRKQNFRFHHISTDEVFGSLGQTGFFSETSLYDPRSPYSASKASSDHLVMAWHHTYGLPVVLTNCSNNYGPWQFPEKLIPVVILNALAGKAIPLYGDGSNVRDWLYVEDHVDALLLVARSGRIGESYCIGGSGLNPAESEKTNKEVVEVICSELDILIPEGAPYLRLVSSVDDRPGHDQRYSINPTKICSELGWKPKHSFQLGISQTVRWYINNQDWCFSVLQKAGYTGERLGRSKL